MKRIKITIFILIGLSIVLPVLSTIIWLILRDGASSPTLLELANLGSILSPVVTILSIVVLGYLSNVFAKYSVVKSQKISAFQELIKKFYEINIIECRQLKDEVINSSVKYLKEHLTKEILYENFKEHSINSMNNLIVFKEFYFELRDFKYKYDYLFDYDFNSAKFIEILGKAKTMNDMVSQLLKHSNNEEELNKIDRKPIYEFFLSKELTNFFDELRVELF